MNEGAYGQLFSVCSPQGHEKELEEEKRERSCCRCRERGRPLL